MPEFAPIPVQANHIARRPQPGNGTNRRRALIMILLAFAVAASMITLTSRPAHAAMLDSRVTFSAESHYKPTTCIWGRLTAQGSAGRPQGVPGKKVLIQKKKKAGWRTVKTVKTRKGGWYDTCLKAGYGKRKGYYRVAVRSYKISTGYKGSRDVSRTAYFW